MSSEGYAAGDIAADGATAEATGVPQTSLHRHLRYRPDLVTWAEICAFARWRGVKVADIAAEAEGIEQRVVS